MPGKHRWPVQGGLAAEAARRVLPAIVRSTTLISRWTFRAGSFMSETFVEVRVEWSVLPPQVDAVGTVLHALLAAIRGEPGCRVCTLGTDMGTLVTLRLREVWESEDALRQHLRSPRFETLASLLESGITQARVEFILPTGTRGFEYARGVRDAIGGPR
jgi:quinol monooxygenase YgiN